MTGRSVRGAFLAAALLAPLPVVLFQDLPLRDYPEHLLMSTVIGRYDDPGSDLCLSYESHFRFAPYVGCYAVAWALGPVLGVAGALRLCVAAYLMATPAATWIYTRELAPARAPAALLSFAALFTAHYYLGLVNFLMALPPSLLSLAAMLRFTRRPSWPVAAAFAGFSALAYLCHAMAVLFVLMAGGAYALLAPRGRRVAASALVAFVALAGAAFTPRDVVPPEAGVRYLRLGEDHPTPGPERGLVFQSPAMSLLMLLGHVACDREGIDVSLWGIAIGALAMGAWGARRRGAPPEDPPPRRERWVLPLLALPLVFVLPTATSYVECVSMKASAFLFLGLPALVPSRWLDARARASLGALAILAMALAVVTGARFQREAAGFERVLAHVPDRPELLMLVFQPESAVLTPGAYLYDHYPQLVHAARGGIGMELWPRPQYPVRSRPEAATGWILFRDRPWLVNARAVPRLPEWLLVKGRAGEKLLPGGYGLVTASGAFSLWRREPPP